METIHINRQENISVLLFPDNQPHVNVNVPEGSEVSVTCSIVDSLSFMHLVLCGNALDNLFCVKKELHIPYLMGARYDRLMNKGDSVDLKSFSAIINSLGFHKVYLYDVHSDVSLMAINNSVNISNKKLVEQYDKPNSVLICPDAGAAKKVKGYFEINTNITDVVYCVKSRSKTGEISLTVLNPENCENRDCVIIDDLCDGGGTFLAIQSQIKPKSLTLIVAHGVFSKGVKVFEGKFDSIITSNSYPSGNQNSGLLKVVDIC